MPLLGTVTYADDVPSAPVARSNGAQRLRALHGALTLPRPVSDAIAEAGGPVLLVDDFTDTGWTIAVAARLLLRAGAQRVLPLVLAVQG
jgi:ATP-dependent DNA helicase RecQ